MSVELELSPNSRANPNQVVAPAPPSSSVTDQIIADAASRQIASRNDEFFSTSLLPSRGADEQKAQDVYTAVEMDDGGAQVDVNEDVLIINNVHKTYLLGVEGVPALRGVNLKVKRGEFVIILGKSGSGKTSLLSICGTIDRPTKGDITINGRRITSTTDDSQLADIRLNEMSVVILPLLSQLTAS